MEIRYLNDKDDRFAISHIYEESWKYAYKGIIPQKYLDEIPNGRWVSNLNKNSMHTLVMLDGDIYIGTASFCKSRFSGMEGYGEIVSIYFLPEYMGQGYGQILLKTAVEELKKMGFYDVFLWVLEENVKARNFYEKFGFKSIGVSLEDNIGGRDLREIQYCYHHA